MFPLLFSESNQQPRSLNSRLHRSRISGRESKLVNPSSLELTSDASQFEFEAVD